MRSRRALSSWKRRFDPGELAPGDASAAANALGRGYVTQSRYDEAFAIFDRFLDEARSPGRSVRRGSVLGVARERLHRSRGLRARPRHTGRGSRPRAPDSRSAAASEPLLVAVARPPVAGRARPGSGIRPAGTCDPRGERANARGCARAAAPGFHRERPRQSGGSPRARRRRRADRRRSR